MFLLIVDNQSTGLGVQELHSVTSVQHLGVLMAKHIFGEIIAYPEVCCLQRQYQDLVALPCDILFCMNLHVYLLRSTW